MTIVPAPISAVKASQAPQSIRTSIVRIIMGVGRGRVSLLTNLLWNFMLKAQASESPCKERAALCNERAWSEATRE
jgi:hypothetical protein